MPFRHSSNLISTTSIDNDLSFLSAAMWISQEPERICDYVYDIAEEALLLMVKGPFFKPMIQSTAAGWICPDDDGQKASLVHQKPPFSRYSPSDFGDYSLIS